MTRIWQDKWLPTPSTFKVVSPCRLLPQDALVNSLIIDHSHSWNHRLIDEVFLPHEAETIKAIPLRPSRPKDSWCWTGTTRGVFSVQSAYHLLKEVEMANDVGSSSNPSLSQHIWKTIWGLGVQPKIRNFLWRACSNILPTRSKLFDKKISFTYSCSSCNEEAETTVHALWLCLTALEAWSLSGLPWLILLPNPRTLADLLEDAALALSNAELIFFTTILWKLWCFRNDAIYGN
jgi:hypothetical protein